MVNLQQTFILKEPEIAGNGVNLIMCKAVCFGVGIVNKTIAYYMYHLHQCL